HDVLGPGVCVHSNPDRPFVFTGPARDSDGREAFAGRGRISTLRWPANGRHRSATGRGRYEDSNARQFHRLLADRPSRGLCFMFQVWMGSAWDLDRVVWRLNDYWFGAFVCLASADAGSVTR